MNDKNFGNFLRFSIERLGIRKKDAAAQIGVSDVTLRSWFLQAVPKMRPENRVRVAKLLGISVDELEQKLVEAMKADPSTQAKWKDQIDRLAEARSHGINAVIAEWESLKAKYGDKEDEADISNVVAGSEMQVPEIPTFRLAVAAGPWTDVVEVGELHDEKQIDDGRFRIWIQGDSMEPKYHDGSLIEFHCLRACGPIGDGSLLFEGKDYYVQVGDRATFKRLEKIEEERLVFRAINRKKYPKPMPANRTEILRMAMAKFILNEV